MFLYNFLFSELTPPVDPDPHGSDGFRATTLLPPPETTFATPFEGFDTSFAAPASTPFQPDFGSFDQTPSPFDSTNFATPFDTGFTDPFAANFADSTDFAKKDEEAKVETLPDSDDEPVAEEVSGKKEKKKKHSKSRHAAPDPTADPFADAADPRPPRKEKEKKGKKEKLPTSFSSKK